MPRVCSSIVGHSRPRTATSLDLPDILRPGDLLVVNETKVIPARLRPAAGSTGGAAEVLLLEPIDGSDGVWEALVRPARKLQPGETLYAPDGDAVVEIGDSHGGRRHVHRPAARLGRLARFARSSTARCPCRRTSPSASPTLTGTRPCTPREPGSAAAPTAGLHFTPELLDALRRRRASASAEVELVVGLDTFRPIAEDDPLEHRMHTERYRVPADTMERCRAARSASSPSAPRRCGRSSRRRPPANCEGRTDIFIHRGFDWQVVDVMMTNFHLPRTTLLMMIDAFVGDRWRDLYADGAGRRLPLPQLRRRDAARPHTPA